MKVPFIPVITWLTNVNDEATKLYENNKIITRPIQIPWASYALHELFVFLVDFRNKKVFLNDTPYIIRKSFEDAMNKSLKSINTANKSKQLFDQFCKDNEHGIIITHR